MVTIFSEKEAVEERPIADGPEKQRSRLIQPHSLRVLEKAQENEEKDNDIIKLAQDEQKKREDRLHRRDKTGNTQPDTIEVRSIEADDFLETE